MPLSSDQITQAACQLNVSTTLPLVCICSLLSFLCGVGIGANDLSANFAMVFGSGSQDMKQSIIYCVIFELLGAAFMGGKVSNTIRNGIIEPVVFTRNRDEVIMGMTCASFSAGLWLYLSTVFGLPVSITHTVIGSIIGFAVYSTGGFGVIEVRGLTVVVLSWVVAPIAAFVVTAALFYVVRRFILLRRGRSFELTVTVLPYLLALSLLCGLMFIVIEQPRILERELAHWVPVRWQLVLLVAFTAVICVVYGIVLLPRLIGTARSMSRFVWERAAVRTESDLSLTPVPLSTVRGVTDENAAHLVPRPSSTRAADADAAPSSTPTEAHRSLHSHSTLSSSLRNVDRATTPSPTTKRRRQSRPRPRHHRSTTSHLQEGDESNKFTQAPLLGGETAEEGAGRTIDGAVHRRPASAPGKGAIRAEAEAQAESMPHRLSKTPSLRFEPPPPHGSVQQDDSTARSREVVSLARTGSDFATATSWTPVHSSEDGRDVQSGKAGVSSDLASAKSPPPSSASSSSSAAAGGRCNGSQAHGSVSPMMSHHGATTTRRIVDALSPGERADGGLLKPPHHSTAESETTSSAHGVLNSLTLSGNGMVECSWVRLAPVVNPVGVGKTGADAHHSTSQRNGRNSSAVWRSQSPRRTRSTPRANSLLMPHDSVTQGIPPSTHSPGYALAGARARRSGAQAHALCVDATMHAASLSARLYGTMDTAPRTRPMAHDHGPENDHTRGATAQHRVVYVAPELGSSISLVSDDEFGDEDWGMDHPLQPINFGGLLVKPFNPRAEYLFTVLQVVMGSISSFVHGAVAGANATTAFIILYDAFSNDELSISNLTSIWSVIPAMLGIAIGIYALGSSLMKTVGVELVTVTPSRGWCIQFGGTFVTMLLTGVGIPVSLSQAQVGAAIGCGILDARSRGVSWDLVAKIIAGWVVTLIVSASTTALGMIILGYFVC